MDRRNKQRVGAALLLVACSLALWGQKPGAPTAAGKPAKAAANPATPQVTGTAHTASVQKTPAAKPKAGAPPSHPPYGLLHLATNVGSFKALQPADTVPAEGTIDIKFQGTVLVSGLQGTVTPSGNVQLAYARPRHQKAVYFGTGGIKVTGKFNAVQFFGRNMSGTYNGFGIVRLYGEFDHNLKTGTYWYGNDVTNKMEWGTGGTTITTEPPASLNTTPESEIKVQKVPGG